MKRVLIRIFKIGAYSILLILTVVLLLEVLFRIYDPFGFRQRGDEVILPKNRKMIFDNKKIPGLDPRIVHTKNSLGFRGAEPPQSLQNYTSIIAVGGSTTECFYLSDSLCWTNLLAAKLGNKFWINNAGFQGHSSYGNFILIDDYIKKIKPGYILLMEGINEIGRTDIAKDESVSVKSRKTTSWGWLKRNSHVLNAIINIQRRLMADRLGVTDSFFDPAKMARLELSPVYIDSVVGKQAPFADAYERRLNRIIDTCVSNSIVPVLITQPILYGDVVDCVTSTDLSTVKIGERYNGELMWRLIELYNSKTRKVASEQCLFLIDLAVEMPKCSRYFYDICHFTNEGSGKVAEVLFQHLHSKFGLR